MKCGLLAACAVVATSGWAVGAPPKDFPSSDVCALVPGTEVAAAAGGTLVEAKLVRPGGTHARCVYTVAFPGPQGRSTAAFVLWLLAPADFADLRRYQEDPIEPLEGLGDEAFTTFHGDSGRHDLFVLIRGLVTIEVTGPDAASVRSVASAAVRRVRPAE